MARRQGRAARLRARAEQLQRMEEIKVANLPEKDATSDLLALKQAYTREVHQALGQDQKGLPPWSSGLSDDSDESDDDSEGESEDEHTVNVSLRICSESERSVRLRGQESNKDGRHAIAAPGYGCGVPPKAKITQCAFVPPGRGRALMVVTAASDGVNLLWVPSSEWQQLGFVPFVSVASRFAGEPCSHKTLRKNVAEGSLRGTYGPGQINTFMRDALGSNAPATTKSTAAKSLAAVRAGKEGEGVRRKELARERDAKVTQDTHLDADREKTMSKLMATTVIHRVDLDIMRRASKVLEDKRLQLTREKESELRVSPLVWAAQRANTDVPVGGRGVVDMVRARHRERSASDSAAAAHAPMSARESRLHDPSRHTDLEHSFGVATTVPPEIRMPPSASQAASVPRQSLRLTCIETHPNIPRFVAGTGDGQLVVYELYRAHGERLPQLHQTVGFDASRQCGDLVTALHVPAQPLAQEGALGGESFIAGFESGRVAVFQVFARVEAQADVKKSRSTDGRGSVVSMAMREEEVTVVDSGRPPPTKEPVLLPKEPLLLCLSCCRWTTTRDSCCCRTDLSSERQALGPVVNVIWHRALGIISISAHGMVIAADTAGNENWRIPSAAGLNASVTCVDLSMRLEQLAVAGHRGVVSLWQCLTQTQAAILDPAEKLKSPVLMVRYLPTHTSLISIHENCGSVLIWDVVRFELQQALQTPQCPRATCAGWDAEQRLLLVFGPKGVAERRLVERRIASESRNSRQLAWAAV